jgi:predicted Zn-dependent peptidase
MIKIEKFELDNGLKVAFHKDETSPIAVVNTLYNVGSKDEDPSKTGFAHLFEHLMFGGSVNVSDFDTPIQLVGGENNAFTSNDITNYYISLPVQNIETAFWLESDRMLALDFSKRKLDIQRSVVIEEFKERYLNKPYGDVWMYLRQMAFPGHPYEWPTIGKEISHIENATLSDVKSFFYHFYAPNNAILVVSANLEFQYVIDLVKKWYGDIPKRDIILRKVPEIGIKSNQTILEVRKDVPYDALYLVFNMCKRTDKAFYAIDLLSDILSNGRSSRFYQNLLMKGEYFVELDAYLSGDIYSGLFVINSVLIEGVDVKEAEKAIWEEINLLITNGIGDYELQKVKNKVISTKVFSELSATNKAYLIAMHELVGDATDINTEIEKYEKVTAEDIIAAAKKILNQGNSSILYYLAEKKQN